MKLLLELIYNGKGGPFIMAKRLEPHINFSLTDNCFVNGVAIQNNLLMPPRVIGPDGKPRMDLIAFKLKNGNDYTKFKEEDIVELTGHKLTGTL